MDVTITDSKRKRSIVFEDVEEIKQVGGAIEVRDKTGWRSRYRVPEHCYVEVRMEGVV